MKPSWLSAEARYLALWIHLKAMWKRANLSRRSSSLSSQVGWKEVLRFCGFISFHLQIVCIAFRKRNEQKKTAGRNWWTVSVGWELLGSMLHKNHQTNVPLSSQWTPQKQDKKLFKTYVKGPVEPQFQPDSKSRGGLNMQFPYDLKISCVVNYSGLLQWSLGWKINIY